MRDRVRPRPRRRARRATHALHPCPRTNPSRGPAVGLAARPRGPSTHRSRAPDVRSLRRRAPGRQRDNYGRAGALPRGSGPRAATRAIRSSRGEPILDGDDIVVEPTSPNVLHVITRWVLIVAIVIRVLVATASRSRSRPATRGQHVECALGAPVHPPAAHPTPCPPAVGTHVSKTPRPKAPVQIAKPTPISVSPPARSRLRPRRRRSASAATTPAVIPPTPPPVTAPPTAPPSVLRWTTSPSALTIKAGGQRASRSPS